MADKVSIKCDELSVAGSAVMPLAGTAAGGVGAVRAVLLLALVVALSGCTSNQIGNTMYGTAVGTLVVDWGQTRAIVRDPANHAEMNPILGPHPTFKQVDTYFPLFIVGTAASYPFIKPSWRPYLYGAITLLESVVIVHNFRNGLHMDFVGVKF